MKRYLVIFIDEEGSFCCETVQADTVYGALMAFDKTRLAHAEIYSVSLAR